MTPVVLLTGARLTVPATSDDVDGRGHERDWSVGRVGLRT
jgi:hypothetical protein